MKETFCSLILITIVLLSSTSTNCIAEKKNDAYFKDMVLIPSGEFVMGSEKVGVLISARLAHNVYIDAFYIDKYEVTNAQYKKFILANPNWQKKNIDKRFHDGKYLHHWKNNNYPPDKANHPVTYVSWYAAMAYAKWLGKRLPTEAEWEKAARGGTEDQSFPWGNENDENKANYRIGIDHDIVGGTVSVGTYPGNGYGLHEVSGNVEEWCLDYYNVLFYKVYPRGKPLNNPIAGADSITDVTSNFVNIDSQNSRITRGGGWISSPREIAVYTRGGGAANETRHDIGFRCVLDLVENEKMVLIPSGEFNMGYEGEGAYKYSIPEHKVYVDAFYIDNYEVTNAEYRKFIFANPQWRKMNIDKKFHDGDYLYDWHGNNYPHGRKNHPVTYVSWYAAMAYAKWVGKRLPTEAEWEKAARGGLNGEHYPWGDTIEANQANYRSSNIGDTVPVGASVANGYKLYDMSGNVSEWCLDEIGWDFYKVSPYRNPVDGVSDISSFIANFERAKASIHRSIRGGSWNGIIRHVSVYDRSYNLPARTESTIGFRCVRDATP